MSYFSEPYRDTPFEEGAGNHLSIIDENGKFIPPWESESAEERPDGFRHGWEDQLEDILFGETRDINTEEE